MDEEDDVSSDGTPEDTLAPVLGRKVLPQRATRGIRRGKLLGTAAEADEEFWGQSAFKEDESDEEFEESAESSGSSETETDSDMDAPEPEDDAGGDGTKAGGAASREREVEDDMGEKKKGKAGRGYLDPALKASSTWSGSLGSIAAAAAASVARASRTAAASAAEGGGGRARRLTHSSENVGEANGPHRALRVTVHTRTGESSSKSVEAAESKGQGSGGNAPPPLPKPTQAEVLTEAAHTAIENLRLLEGQMKIERARVEREAAEAAAGRGKGHTVPQSTPIVRFHSRRGTADTVTFTCVDAIPQLGVGSGVPAAKPMEKRCVVIM